MTTEQKRQKLREVYPSPKWVDRVNRMDERQIVAIYFRLLREGKIKS